MSLSSGDLTTLADAKSYVTPLPNDAVLTGLITRVSRMIQTVINRSLLVPKNYVQQFNGTGNTLLVLPNYPLIGASLTSLQISGSTIQLAPQPTDIAPPSNPWGYRIQPWDGLPPGAPAVVELVGGAIYLYGNQNVIATYKAGYQVSLEKQTIPTTPFQVTPQTPYGIWATDEGVTNANTGAALTAIASGTPSTGQYVPPNPNANPTPIPYYQFAAADVGTSVLLNYGFIPADLEQVCLEMISERASYRMRAGVRSQSLASQESITYEDGLNKWEIEALIPYTSVIPPAMGASV